MLPGGWLRHVPIDQFHHGQSRRRVHAPANPLVFVHREPLLVQPVDPGPLRLQDEAHHRRHVLEVLGGRRLAVLGLLPAHHLFLHRRDFLGGAIVRRGLVVQECLRELAGLSFLERADEMPNPLVAGRVSENELLSIRSRKEAGKLG